MSAFIASLHYLALAIGFAGLVLRQYFIIAAKPNQSVKPVFLGDNLWGIAALLWIVTGLLRAFGGLEKGTAFYLQNQWFFIKMGLFFFIFLLELYPMIKFIRWRMSKKKTIDSQDLFTLKTIGRINLIEVILIILLIFTASQMARGL